MMKKLIIFLAIYFLVAHEVHAVERGKSGSWRAAVNEIDVSEEDYEQTEVESAEEEEAPSSKIVPQQKAVSNKEKKEGQLVIHYNKPTDKSYLELAKLLKETKGMDIIVEAINETYDFPHIDVVFDLCGQSNAFYLSDERKIILCYELVSSLAEEFSKDPELTEDEVGEQIMASLIFTFFHELGHAAIDVFDLPLTGNEEDAVDRFATLLLVSDDEDNTVADSAITAFDLDAAESLDDLNFSDEHPVNEQRWYTMACLMVGSNPQKYNYLVGENGLPEDRAENCEAEYQKIHRSWNVLMKDHLL